MNIYTISQPGKQIVDVQGVSIRTVNVSVTVPPSVPNYFNIYAAVTQPNGSSPIQFVGTAGYSITVPVITQTFSHFYLGQAQCWTSWTGTNQFGQQTSGYAASQRQVCGTAYLTPGNTTVNRCDIIVTVQASPLQEITLQGLNGQPCGTWTTRSVDDCLPTEIKCNDPSDPKGFCCIPCDTLNNKIRALII